MNNVPTGRRGWWRRALATAATLGALASPIALAARGETPAAFGRRCIPAPPHRAEKRAVGAPAADCVAPPSNIPDILGRRALLSGRLAGLGATLDFHHGLPAASAFDRGISP